MKNILLFLAIILISSDAIASTPVTQGSRTVGVPNPPNNFNTQWDGSSNIVIEEGFCAVSFRSIGPFRLFNTGIDFSLSSSNGYSVDNRYLLINNLDGTSLPFTIELLNVDSGAYQNALPETETSSGTGLGDCSGEGQSPFIIRLTIASSEMANVSQGTYNTTLTMTAEQTNSNSPETNDNININITIPYIVQVSQLNDMNLGSYTFIGDLLGEEQFCIFRNKNYTFNIRFNDGESGSLYYLRGEEDNYLLPYIVDFKYETGAYINTFKNSTITYTPPTSSVNCNNQDSYFIRVTIIEAELQKAYADNYKSTLNVIVSPE